MTFIEFAEKDLGIELLDWQKVVLEKAQKCKDDGKSFYIHTDARAGKMLLNNIYQQKLGYDRGFEDGRAYEQLQSIEDAKQQATEYLDALNKAKKETYQQGKVDGFQEALTSNGINIYADKIEADGARKFAEWLCSEKCGYINGNNHFTTGIEDRSIDEVLSEWQKGAKND